uniref:Cytochrome P450 n=1 Tax=Plectus sambesii TaxID=2011161 RepID=A0A914X5C8_9BILA
MPSPERNVLMQLSSIFPEIGGACAELNAKLSSGGQSETWLFKQLSAVIEQRKAAMQEFEGSNDALQLLLNPRQSSSLNPESQRRNSLTDREIANNCFAFLLAGYETTSTALAFSAWLLAKNSSKQSILQEEIDEHLGSQESEGWYEKVMKLPYLDAVFHEALRMYPPITFFVNRTCVRACEIDGVKFEPGVQVSVPIWTIHHDPEVWPEPEKFKPERFYKNKDYHPMAWLPFGAGPRNCVGMRFGEMQFKMALARLMSRFSLELGPESQDPLPVRNPTAMLNTDRVVLKVSERKIDVNQNYF